MDNLTLGMAGLFNLFFCCFYIFFIIISIVVFIHWLWMLIDLIKRQDNEFGSNTDTNAKSLWALIILLGGAIGSIIYYFLIYRKYPRN